jgi:hypothetical protein
VRGQRAGWLVLLRCCGWCWCAWWPAGDACCTQGLAVTRARRAGAFGRSCEGAVRGCAAPGQPAAAAGRPSAWIVAACTPPRPETPQIALTGLPLLRLLFSHCLPLRAL